MRLLAASIFVIALIASLGSPVSAQSDETTPQTTELFEQAKAAISGKDYPKARQILHQSCDQDELMSCTYLGKVMISGGLGFSDPKAGRDMLLTTCFRGDKFACQFFAVVTGGGQGGPVDLYAARHIFAYSCDKGDGRSCYYSAMDYDGAMGLPADSEAGMKALQRACHLDHQDACKALNEK